MKKILVVAAVALLLVTGCGQKSNDKSKVLKVVGKVKITEADIQKEVDNIPAQYKAAYDNENGRKLIEFFSLNF